MAGVIVAGLATALAATAVGAAADGLVHVTYTWQRRRLRHAVADAARVETRPIDGGEWPWPAGPSQVGRTEK